MTGNLLDGYISSFFIVDDIIYHLSKRSSLVFYQNFRHNNSTNFTCELTWVDVKNCSPEEIVEFYVDKNFIYLSTGENVYILENKNPFQLKKKLDIPDENACSLASSQHYFFVVEQNHTDVPTRSYSYKIRIFDLSGFSEIGFYVFRNSYPKVKLDHALNFSYNPANDLCYCIWRKEIQVFYFCPQKKTFFMVQSLTTQALVESSKHNEFYHFLPHVAFGRNQDVIIGFQNKDEYYFVVLS